MLKTVNENEADKPTAKSAFRERILSRDGTENLSLPSRKLSSPSSPQFNRQKSGDKLYETYAEFYLKTKRSGSLAVPYNAYSSKQQKGMS